MKSVNLYPNLNSFDVVDPNTMVIKPDGSVTQNIPYTSYWQRIQQEQQMPKVMSYKKIALNSPFVPFEHTTIIIQKFPTFPSPSSNLGIKNCENCCGKNNTTEFSEIELSEEVVEPKKDKKDQEEKKDKKEPLYTKQSYWEGLWRIYLLIFLLGALITVLPSYAALSIWVFVSAVVLITSYSKIDA